MAIIGGGGGGSDGFRGGSSGCIWCQEGRDLSSQVACSSDDGNEDTRVNLRRPRYQ